jgi:hypothetical protein
MMIELITNWIVTAFSSFTPKWEPAKMGAALPGFQTELFQSLPLQNFSPTSENSFLFPPYLLPAIYYLLRLRQAPSYCNRNALHTATETPFTVQPKRPSYCNRSALSFFAKMHHAKRGWLITISMQFCIN